MFSPGIQLNVLIGRTVPTPAGRELMLALRSAEVTTSDAGRSGFQLAFQLARSSLPLEWDLESGGHLAPFNRVILSVAVRAVPTVIMDGMILQRDLVPGDAGAPDQLIVSGQDISVLMDRYEESRAHPPVDEVAVLAILETYLQYGIVAEVLAAPQVPEGAAFEYHLQQRETDRAFVERLAQRRGFVFQMIPGPAPMMNQAYWGPPKRLGVPHPALTVNLPPATNVESIRFHYDALAPQLVTGSVQDTLATDQQIPIRTIMSTQVPPFASSPAVLTQRYVRRKHLVRPGWDPVQAEALAQGITDLSADRALTAQGDLDVQKYGHILSAPGVVSVRGAGAAHDGLYRVTSVTHNLTPDSYRQSFVLAREGLGTTIPLVTP